MPLGQRATPGSGIPELPFGSLLANAGRNIRFCRLIPPGIIIKTTSYYIIHQSYIMNTILVTGSAGFIGANLVKRLFQEMDGGTVVGVDNLNDYYDPSLKEYRLRELDKAKPAHIDYRFVKGSIADRDLINRLFAEYKFDIVVNLAA